MAPDTYRRILKPIVDAGGAAVALVLVAPVLLGVAGAIWLRMGRPVLFAERRAGMHGEPFVLWKFRTMTDERDREGNLLPDARRITALGRFLRRASLDELPELVNVLKRDMSLVGPRPLPVRYVSRYTPQQARRLEVKPGLSGVAQVRGRNALSWHEKFALDVWYVDHGGLAVDLAILLATVRVVLTGRGVSQPGHATMEEFMGQQT